VRPTRLVPVLLTGSLVVAGLGVGGGLAVPKRATVDAQFSGFTPATITVKQRTKVTWTNLDGFQHNAVSTVIIRGEPAFTSGALTTGDFWAKAPHKSGTYPYICERHPTTMRGTLIVD
jgi:plastocyanin